MSYDFDEMWRINADYVINHVTFPTKKFSGHIYHRYGEHYNGKSASRITKALRRVGYLARIQDHPTKGYVIWVRRKK
jgi:hypothetical protein